MVDPVEVAAVRARDRPTFSIRFQSLVGLSGYNLWFGQILSFIKAHLILLTQKKTIF